MARATLLEAHDLPVKRVGVCNLGGILGIEFPNDLLRWQNRASKRLLDLTLGSIFFALALPVMIVGGCLVKLMSRGPFLFCQIREGLGGHPIKVRKLPTVYQDAEQRLEACLATDLGLRREWEEHFKLVRDRRVIPMVGPLLRPLSAEFRELRRRVCPGLTGLWQVTVRSDGGIDEQQLYGTYCLRNRSTWLDLWSLLRTIRAVLLSKGAR